MNAEKCTGHICNVFHVFLHKGRFPLAISTRINLELRALGTLLSLIFFCSVLVTNMLSGN